MMERDYLAMLEIVENHIEGNGAAIYTAVSRLGGGKPRSEVEMIDNIAVVPISGTIVPMGSMMEEISSATSPSSIQRSFLQAMESDADVVVLDINSPGGAAVGIEETGDLIYNARKASDKLVLAFSSGTMASAAYWIGSQADAIISTKDATVGSVGVIATVVDESRKEKNEGIDRHVIRSGPNKQIGNGPVTESQLDVLRSKRDMIFNSFVSSIERSRSKLSDDVKTGRDYLGAQALKEGIVDANMTFSELINQYRKKK